MRGHSKRENREIPSVSQLRCSWERSVNVSDGTADMYANGKSHGSIVPAKQANKTGTPAAESVEERESLKGSDVLLMIMPDTEPEHMIHCMGKHPRLVAMAPS